MEMTIFFGCESSIIFDGVKTDCTSIWFACLLFFLLNVLFEFLLTYKLLRVEKYKRVDNLDLDQNNKSDICAKLEITSIHFLICLLIYVSMFGLMTYNGNIILAVILGNAFGYLLFGFPNQENIRKAGNVGCCHSG